MSRPRRIAALNTLAVALAGIGAASAGAATTVGPAIGMRFATVSSTGSLVAAQSLGVTSAQRAAQGKFKVVFDASIERCAVSAASLAGNTSSSTYGYDTRIMTAISGSALYVTLMGRYDGPADYPFSVVLACKQRTVLAQPTMGDAVTPGAGGIKPGSGSGTVSALDGVIRFATVSSSGSLVAAQSYGAASALRAAQGKFKVVFDSSLAGCAVSAASLAGSTSASTYGFSTRIMTVISGSSLYVTLMGQNDGPADYPFSVVLACNP